MPSIATSSLPWRGWGRFGSDLILAIGVVFIAVIAPNFRSSLFAESYIIPRMFALAAGAVLLWIAALTREPRRSGTSLDSGLRALWAAMIVTTVFSLDPSLSILGEHMGQFHGLLTLALCTVIYYGARFSTVTIIDLILAGSLPVFFLVFGQFKGAPLVHLSSQGGRVTGSFGSPIFLGAYLAVILPLSWAWLREEASWRRVLGLVAGAGCCLSVVASQSRGAALGGVVSIAIYEWIRGNRRPVVFVAAAGAALLAIQHPHGPASDLGRFEIWKAALVGWMHYPILGSGPDTFRLIYCRFVSDNIVTIYHSGDFIQISAHNDLLQVLATMGLVGLAAYLLFAYNVFWIAFKNASGGNARNAVLAALVSVFVLAKFNPVHLIAPALCALLLGSLEEVGEVVTGFRARASTVAFACLALAVFGIARKEARASFFEEAAVNLASNKQYPEALHLFNMAATEDPWHIHYMNREIDALWTLAPLLKDKMKTVAAISIWTVDRAVKIHPFDPVAHDMRALALKTLAMGYAKDTLAESQVEMNQAISLYPTFEPYTRDARFIAHDLHDAKAVAALDARLDQLHHLGHP